MLEMHGTSGKSETETLFLERSKKRRSIQRRSVGPTTDGESVVIRCTLSSKATWGLKWHVVEWFRQKNNCTAAVLFRSCETQNARTASDHLLRFLHSWITSNRFHAMNFDPDAKNQVGADFSTSDSCHFAKSDLAGKRERVEELPLVKLKQFDRIILREYFTTNVEMRAPLTSRPFCQARHSRGENLWRWSKRSIKRIHPNNLFQKI